MYILYVYNCMINRNVFVCSIYKYVLYCCTKCNKNHPNVDSSQNSIYRNPSASVFSL